MLKIDELPVNCYKMKLFTNLVEGEYMMKMGVKRKLEDDDPFVESPKENQRQCILDISVGKLKTRTVKRVEPPLLRSVLILNTLKHIETELLKEGMQSPRKSTPFTIPEVDPQSTVIDFIPEPESLQKMDTDYSPPLQSGPLPSIDTFVGVKVTQVVDAKLLESIDTSLNSNSDSSFTTLHPPSIHVEDTLPDIDFSSCEFDMFSSLSTCVKLTPLSAEEVSHSVPNTNSTFENYTNLLGSTLSPFCKGEVAMEELDNIMQILVGS